MNVFSEAAIKFLKELCRNLCKHFRRNRLFHRPDLNQGFFRAGLFIEPQILRGTVPVGMPGLPVSFMLAFAEIIVTFRIKSTLDMLEGINDPVFLFLIFRKVKSLIAVPVDILLRPILINVFTVGNVKTAVIVLRIISAVLCCGKL